VQSGAIYRREAMGFDRLGGMPASGKISPLKRSATRNEDLARVRAWTRERFTLAADAAILVSEVACRVPGCPPLETVVVFWIGETRHHFKFFKPARDVAFGDFPPAWLRNTLAVPDGIECDCC
jgi:hypothetical protein